MFDFFSATDPDRKRLQQDTLKRTVAFPLSMCAGYMVLMLSKESLMLLAIPFSSTFVFAAIVSAAVFLIPYFFLMDMIEKYVPNDAWTKNLCYGLLMFIDFLVSTYTMSFLMPFMSVYLAGCVFAAGVIPIKLICLPALEALSNKLADYCGAEPSPDSNGCGF